MAIHNETNNPIDEKIELLHDFCLLRNDITAQEVRIRFILEACTSEIQMEHKLHNVLYGGETLKELVDRHGGKHMKLANELGYVVQRFKQIKNLETYAENLKKSGAYDDFETRLGWDCLRASIPTETVCDWYRKYECTDAHITTLVKAALKKVRGEVSYETT